MANKGFYAGGPNTMEWQTPPALFDLLWDEYGPFNFDPCTRRGQYTAERVLKHGGTICVPPGDRSRAPRVLVDGLAHAWSGRVFMNPPYARDELGRWVHWAQVQAAVLGGAERVVALLPVRTDSRWWRLFVCSQADRVQGIYGEAAVVRFLPGRVRFVGAQNHARSASAVVVWGDLP